eukprot:365525-Chlamydomonas_euryale.AAC.12
MPTCPLPLRQILYATARFRCPNKGSDRALQDALARTEPMCRMELQYGFLCERKAFVKGREGLSGFARFAQLLPFHLALLLSDSQFVLRVSLPAFLPLPLFSLSPPLPLPRLAFPSSRFLLPCPCLVSLSPRLAFSSLALASSRFLLPCPPLVLVEGRPS